MVKNGEKLYTNIKYILQPKAVFILVILHNSGLCNIQGVSNRSSQTYL